MSDRILVTAAAGKTGRAAVKSLAERGADVRAQVRVDDDRADALRDLGAEVVLADLHRPADLRRIVRGVRGAYFLHPPGPGLLAGAVAFGHIAAEEGVEIVVDMSQRIAAENAPSPLSREHWLAERALDAAGVGAVHIRPTLFAEMPLILGGEGLARDGVLALPWGAGSHAPITTPDIGRVVARLLIDPAPEARSIHVLTGPERLDGPGIAALIGEAMGREVTYRPVPPEAWDAAAREQGWPDDLVTHLRIVGEQHAAGAFDGVTDDVERITGSPATHPSSYFTEVAESGIDAAVAALRRPNRTGRAA